MSVFFRGAPPSFSWARMLLAMGLLVLLFLAAVYTAHDPALAQLHTVVVHGFELGLGGVMGLLVGEASS